MSPASAMSAFGRGSRCIRLRGQKSMSAKVMDYIYKENGEDWVSVARPLEEGVALVPQAVDSGLELGNACDLGFQLRALSPRICLRISPAAATRRRRCPPPFPRHAGFRAGLPRDPAHCYPSRARRTSGAGHAFRSGRHCRASTANSGSQSSVSPAVTWPNANR